MEEYDIYRVSFGQKYAHEPHPRFSLAHPDHVLEIAAVDYDDARNFVALLLGSSWSDIYTPKRWPEVAHMFHPEPSCRLITPGRFYHPERTVLSLTFE